MIPARYALCAAAALVLAACGDDAADGETSTEGVATGEVFEPTVSDAMIATDQLKSSPPLLRTQPQPAAIDGEPEEDAMEQAFGEGEAEPASALEPEPQSEVDEPAP